MMHRPALLICTGLGLLALARAQDACVIVQKGSYADDSARGVFLPDDGSMPTEVEVNKGDGPLPMTGSFCDGCSLAGKGDVATMPGRFWNADGKESPVAKGDKADEGGMFCPSGADDAGNPCEAACPKLALVQTDCKQKDPVPEGKDVCELDMDEACATTINAAITCAGEEDACKELMKMLDADKGTMACIDGAAEKVADGAQEAKGIVVAAAALMLSLLF